MSYQNIKDRLFHGHRKIANNTYLLENQYGEKQIDMELYGNLIARFYPEYFQLYSANWYTTTTKNRLNLALDIARILNPSQKRIYQKDGQWYYGNYHKYTTKFYNRMKIDYSGKVIGRED